MATNKPNLSSTPIPPPSRLNPNARASETKDPMRRSFTGNPFVKPSSIVPNSRASGLYPHTPANSPSDFARRSSVGRESLTSLKDFEDKENSKDSSSKTARVRSPASASKGTKNFMSPTISAASKFATSPRKKILADKNEPARSSISFPEAKPPTMEGNDKKPEIILSKKKSVTLADVKDLIMEDDDVLLSKAAMSFNQVESSHDSTVNDLEPEEISKAAMGFNVESSHDSTITDLYYEEVLDLKTSANSSTIEASSEENDCAKLDPTFKISPRDSRPPTPSPTVAPLDADPLMPPYDPKTNYLSPRPQFLYYRPNPRIESILNKVKDGKQLEEIFASESSSGSEVSEVQSDDSLKESEEISSHGAVKETREEEAEAKDDEEQLNVPEPTTTDNISGSEQSIQAKEEIKSKRYARSKFVVFGLILIFACLSFTISESQVSDLTFSNFYVPPEITEYAKANLEELVRKSQLWSTNSFAYICNVISSLRGVQELGHLQFSNLTVLLENDQMVDGVFKFEQDFKNALLTQMRKEDINQEEDNEEVDDVETDYDENIDTTEDDMNLGELLEAENSQQSEEIAEVSDEDIHAALDVQINSQSDESFQSDDSFSTTEVQVIIKPDNLESELPQATAAASEDVKLQSNMDIPQQNAGSETEPDVAAPPMGDDEITLDVSESIHSFNMTKTFVISLSVLLSLLAATTLFTYTKTVKPSRATNDEHLEQKPAVVAKKSDHGPISVSVDHTKNWQNEEETVGESCPSEMSSSFKNSSYYKASSDAQSQQRKQQQPTRSGYRRESLASSENFSMESPSYGSFTTYEKVSIKRRGEEDEIVTPVRRSSRIRKQVTSP